MPAKSQKQQKASAIALKAKKDGTVEDLSKNSASYQMAKSMSKKELEDFASTKSKKLPENNENIIENWEDALLVQEEMLGLDDEPIATAVSKKERVKKFNNKRKGYKDLWVNSVPPTANGSRNPMTNNSMGTRVSENTNPNSLDILFEQSEEKINSLKEGIRILVRNELRKNLKESIATQIEYKTIDSIVNEAEEFDASFEKYKNDKIDEMVNNLLSHYNDFGHEPNSWTPEALYKETFKHEPDENDDTDVEMLSWANDAIKFTNQKLGLDETSNRWKKLANIKEQDDDPTKLVPDDNNIEQAVLSFLDTLDDSDISDSDDTGE